MGVWANGCAMRYLYDFAYCALPLTYVLILLLKLGLVGGPDETEVKITIAPAKLGLFKK